MFFRGRSKEAKEAKEPGHEARDSPEAVLLDEATGLYKSWYFERRAHEEVQRCARYGRAFAVIFWEPRLLPGEVLADEAIARVSDVIKDGLRQTDLAAQLERTRFAALLVESEHNTARTVAYRMKASLASRVRGGPGTWRTGVAVFPDDGIDVATLFQVAVRKLSEDVGVAV
jgi:PleD family two-component response regulator